MNQLDQLLVGVTLCARADDMIAPFVDAYRRHSEGEKAPTEDLTRAFLTRWDVRTLRRIRSAARARLAREVPHAAGMVH